MSRSLVSQAGATLVKHRKRYWLTCETCGLPIAGIWRRRYCSRPCRDRAYRARRKQLAQAARAAQP